MKIFSDIDGKLISYLPDTDIDRYPNPTTYTSTISFDDQTNPDLVIDLNRNWSTYTLITNTLYHNGVPVPILPPTEQHQAEAEAKIGYPLLPDWARTATPQQASDYVTAQVWGGQTLAQATTKINTDLTDITTANVAQINVRLGAIRTLFILVAGAVIGLRDLMALEAKLIMYLRDLVIRFRK